MQKRIKLRLISSDKVKARILLKLARLGLAQAKLNKQVARLQEQEKKLFTLYVGFTK